MPTFPTKPAEIIALLKTMAAGFSAHPDIFPNPPHPSDDLNGEGTSYDEEHTANLEAQAVAETAKEKEKRRLEKIRNMVKANIAYAIHVTQEERELNFIGWSNRSAPTPTPPPEQATSLQAPRYGDGTVYLRWTAPKGGGKVQAYRIQRREIHTDGPDTEWTVCDMSFTTEATLTNQPRGIMLEYRVISANIAGDSEASNVVSLTM